MNKAERILATTLLMASTIIKVWSVVVLYTIYTHTEEVAHDSEHKARIKKAKMYTHRPL